METMEIVLGVILLAVILLLSRGARRMVFLIILPY